MTTNTNELRSLMTPMFVLFCSVALVFLAAMILRDPSRAGGDLVMVSPGSDTAFHPTPLPPQNSTPSTPPSSALAAAEDQLVKNMAYFDSRFERYTAELHLEEEKALSRSDLVGTRYQIKSLQEDVATLLTRSHEWETMNTDLQTNVIGSQIAGSSSLLDDYVTLLDRSLLSARDVTELSERLQPLSDFVAMLEDQDKVAYEPSERFQSRLTTMVHNVAKSMDEFEGAILELNRLQREAQTLAPLEETLREAVYRRRRELSAATTLKKSATESSRFRDDTVEPPEEAVDEPEPSAPDNKKTSGPVMTAETTSVSQPRLFPESTPLNAARTDEARTPLWSANSHGQIQPDANGNYLPARLRKSPANGASGTSPPSSTVQRFVCSKCGRVWTFRTAWTTTRRCSSNCRCR